MRKNYPLLCLYTGTVPSSDLQQVHISGSCFKPSTYNNGQFQCSNPQLFMSTNKKSLFVGLFSHSDFFYRENSHETLHICFMNVDLFLNTFGDVSEVQLQEYCAINPNNLCANVSLSGDVDYAQVYGSRGVLYLLPNGTGLY